MERIEDQEVIDDLGLVSRLQELAEPVRAIAVEPLSLAGQAVESFNRHRKGILQLGALGLGTLTAGFATAALRTRHA